MERLLAKSKSERTVEETLEEHIENVCNVWVQLKQRYEKVITYEDFWKYSFFSAIFHDFGKASVNFQNMIRKEGLKLENFRHELLSGVYYYYLNNENTLNNNLLLMSVFSHHKKLDLKLFQDDYNKTLKLYKIFLDQISSFIFDMIQKYGFNLSLKKTLQEYNQYFVEKITLNKLYNVFEDILESVIISSNLSDRKKYILYKAILTTCDWIGSGDKKLNSEFLYTKENLKDKIIDKLIKDGKHDIANTFRFRKFQLDSITDKNVIAIAPTGSGKTEASLLWASKKGEYDRIIYLLPTRVTSNSIYKRLTSYFGAEQCSVVHSSAYLFLKEITENYNKRDYFKEKLFFKNINVCTIDQILTQGFNFGYWELKTFNMLTAKVIIDEIHLYQPYTLGLIISTIKYLRINFGCKFYIMSATIPDKLIKLLQNALGENTKIIKDSELLEISRNTFFIKEKNIDELDNEILWEIKANKKILIVVNTVNEAIRIYEKYKNSCENVYCFHSRFIQKDRVKKEEAILFKEKQNVPMILIATQVIEVSLDIDFDILFTENAPIDAIIQRAGRVNRNRQKENSKVIIFKHTEVTEKFVYDKPEILQRTFDIFKENNGIKLTERNLVEFVEMIYQDYNIESDEWYKTGLSIYTEIQKKNNYILDNSGDDKIFTREGLDTISVIPLPFEEKINNLTPEEKTKYEVSVRKNNKIMNNKRKEKDGFFILDKCEYCFEKGLEFLEKDSNKILCI